MQRTPVKSSHLVSIGYEPGSRMLHIEFHDGSVYEYSGVPEYLHKQLLDARSTGSIFHRHIKPHFQAKKVE